MNWLAVGVSLFATSFSAISFLAYPREGAFADYTLFLTLLCIPLIIVPVVWLVFLPVFVRHGVTSIYEILETRFDRRTRRLGTLLFAGYAIGWMGSMLYGMGLILQALLGLDATQTVWLLVGIGAFAIVYTMLGGMQAVVWSDVLQTLVLGGSVLLVLFLALDRIDGGAGAVIEAGRADGKFAMLNWTADLTERRTVWAALAFALFMYLPGYAVSQVTAQRYVCMPSLSHARRALVLSAVVSTAVCLLFFFTGTTLYVFYQGAGGLPELARQDQILPHFVSAEVNLPGLTGLLLAGLFSAAMSTMDSGINSLTAVVVYDWLGGRQASVRTSRYLTVLFGSLVIGAALGAPYLGQHLIEIITKVAGSFLGLLLGVYLLGLFSKRANPPGVLLGFAAGVLALAWVWIGTPLPHWWYGGVTITAVVLVGEAASRFFPAPGAEALRARWSANGGGAPPAGQPDTKGDEGRM
jgi:SSS family transporter